MSTSKITDYIGHGLHADRPSPPLVYSGSTAVFYETDTTNLCVWDGSAWQVISGGGGSYTLPTATTSVLGGVRVGTGLDITEDGHLEVSGGSYTLPTATTSVLGGVKVGTGLDITGDGHLDISSLVTNFPGGYSSAIELKIINIYTGTLHGSLTTPVPSDGTDYVVPLHLTGAQAAEVFTGVVDTTNFTDVAVFFNNAGTWEQIDIDYDIDTNGAWSHNNITLWFKLQASLLSHTVSPPTGSGAYLLCFGQASPTVKRDWSNIYPFQDHFPGSSLDLTKWTTDFTGDPEVNYGTVVVSGSAVALNVGDGLNAAIQSVPTFLEGYQYRAKAIMSVPVYGGQLGFAGPSGVAPQSYFGMYFGTPDTWFMQSYDGSTNSVQNFAATMDALYHVITCNRDPLTGQVSGSILGESETADLPGGTITGALTARFYAAGSNGDPGTLATFADWIKIRPWVPQEPIVLATLPLTPEPVRYVDVFNPQSSGYKRGDLVTWENATYVALNDVAAAGYEGLILGGAPIAYWPLNTGDAHDATGHGHDGGAFPSNVTDVADSPAILPGGHSVLFTNTEGSSDPIAIANAVGFPMSGSMTLEMWLKNTYNTQTGLTTTEDNAIMSWGDISDGSYSHIVAVDTGINFASLPGTIALPEIWGEEDISESWGDPAHYHGPQDVWHHLAMVLDAGGDLSAIYIDGVSRDPLALSISFSGTGPSVNGYIGVEVPAWGRGGEIWYGNLAHIALYDYPFTAADVLDRTGYVAPGPIVSPSGDPNNWAKIGILKQLPPSMQGPIDYSIAHFTFGPGTTDFHEWVPGAGTFIYTISVNFRNLDGSEPANVIMSLSVPGDASFVQVQETAHNTNDSVQITIGPVVLTTNSTDHFILFLDTDASVDINGLYHSSYISRIQIA